MIVFNAKPKLGYAILLLKKLKKIGEALFLPELTLWGQRERVGVRTERAVLTGR